MKRYKIQQLKNKEYLGTILLSLTVNKLVATNGAYIIIDKLKEKSFFKNTKFTSFGFSSEEMAKGFLFGKNKKY